MKTVKSNRRWRGDRGTRGFTLIEMLMVMVILGILASVVVPRVVGYGEKARKAKAEADLQSFKTGLGAFEIENGFFPKGRDGLSALIAAPANAPHWTHRYLDTDRVPLDPWGNPYVYECPGKRNADGYDLMSAGPDGRPGDEDDIANYTIGSRSKSR
jgi:general secretion pathway protein G